MKRITPDLVMGLWHHMSQHYQSTIHDKHDSDFMFLVGRSLDVMGILDQEKFMSTYTTTIGDDIYIPFELGVSENYSLISQVRICAHEHEHVVQFRRGGAQFMLEYLSDSTLRAGFEVEAMRCNMEIQWWYNNTLPNIHASTQKLKDYNCNDKDIATAAKALEMVAKVVERDGIVSNAGKVAIRYLDSVVI